MSLPFQLSTVPTLSRSTVDRQESLRTDPERLRSRWPDARVVLLDDSARTPVRPDETTLATRKARDFGDEPPEEAVFLGEWEGVDHWALPGGPQGEPRMVQVRGSWGVPVEVPSADGEHWVELRGHGDQLDDTSAGLFTTAVGLRNWHRRARYCARCGGVTTRTQFGWSTRCESCGREEYPRTDPAVICLVHDEVGVNGERVLLGRQPIWPADRYSVLAGFVEAGESLEGCVAREIREEVGVEVQDIRYLGSQPWPFPRSIMLGFAARADRTSPLKLAEDEIEDARWVTRADLRAAIEQDGPTPIDGGRARLMLPGNASIAHVMLRSWAMAEA